MMTKGLGNGSSRELGDVVSIIGPGMKITGDCESDGTIRVEGSIEGSVKAAKSVVVGKDGLVVGDITTQDAIIAGRVNGSVKAESRVELQASCRIEGDISSRRVKLEEGGQIDGVMHMGANVQQRSDNRQKANGATKDAEAQTA
jgi:cytoskeletal protein CcmA (bactofilin family)